MPANRVGTLHAPCPSRAKRDRLPSALISHADFSQPSTRPRERKATGRKGIYATESLGEEMEVSELPCKIARDECSGLSNTYRRTY